MMLSQLAEVGITLNIEYAANATASSLTQDSSDFDIAIRQAGFTEETSWWPGKIYYECKRSKWWGKPEAKPQEFQKQKRLTR